MAIPHLPVGMHWDLLLPAFGVRVQKYARTFLIVRNNGRRLKLGRYPAVSLSDAREAARKQMTAPSLHIASFSVSEAIQTYLDSIQVRPNTHRLYKLFLTKFEGHYGAKQLQDITPRQCAEVIESPHMHLTMKTFFNWQIGQAHLTVNPMQNVKAVGKFGVRSRVLNDDELKRVWIASGELGSYGAIVRLCILLAARRGEIPGPTLSSEKIITFIGTKNGRDHSLPITPLMHSLFKEVRPHHSWDRHQKTLLAKAGVEGFVLHDLRRTTATNLARLGTDPFLIERILNHAMPKIQQIYNRHDFTEEMRKPLENHQAWLLKLVKS